MTIYYWSHTTLNKKLNENPNTFQLLNVAAQSLVNREYSHRDLEKLHCPQSAMKIYSYRLNDEARMLFTTHKKCLHVLEYLPNHEYKASRFLRRGVLKKYLEKSDDIIFSPIAQESDSIEIDESQSSSQWSQLDYFNEQFIQLSTQQNETIQSPLPLILNGTAGSGKTYVAFSVLENYLDTMPLIEKPLLYLSANSKLVNSMQEKWVEFTDEDKAHRVHFRSYKTLFENKKIADLQTFKVWYDNKNCHKLKNLPYEQAYYEFKTIAVFSLDAYLELGSRQSKVAKEDRAIWYDHYHNYLDDLKTNDQVDLNFTAPIEDLRQCYQLVIVDEAQLLSVTALRYIDEMTTTHQIIYCMDPHQNTEDPICKRELLSMSYYNDGLNITQHHLGKTYRCPKHVAEIANQVIDIEYQVTGGKSDKYEVAEMQVSRTDTMGHALRICPSQLQAPEYNWIHQRAKTPNLVILTQNEFKQEAIDIFKTKLVFSPNQIQGLEYHTVIMYKPLADKQAITALAEIKKSLIGENDLKKKQHRPKTLSTLRKWIPWFHQFFVSISRSTNTLIWIDEKNRKNALLIDAIDTTIANQQTTVSQDNDQLPTRTWEDEAKRLKAAGIDISELDKAIHQKPELNTQTLDEAWLNFLVSKNPNPNIADIDGQTLLMHLIIHQKIEEIHYLLTFSKIDLGLKTKERRRTALDIAILGEHWEIIPLIVNHKKFQPHKEDECLLLYILADPQIPTEIADFLLNHPALSNRINKKEKEEKKFIISALMTLSQNSRTDFLEILLAHRSICWSTQEIPLFIEECIARDKYEYLNCFLSGIQSYSKHIDFDTILNVFQYLKEPNNKALREIIFQDENIINILKNATELKEVKRKRDGYFEFNFHGLKYLIRLDVPKGKKTPVKIRPIDFFIEGELITILEILILESSNMFYLNHLFESKPIAFWNNIPETSISFILNQMSVLKYLIKKCTDNPDFISPILDSCPKLKELLIHKRPILALIIKSEKHMEMTQLEHTSFLKFLLTTPSCALSRLLLTPSYTPRLQAQSDVQAIREELEAMVLKMENAVVEGVHHGK